MDILSNNNLFNSKYDNMTKNFMQSDGILLNQIRIFTFSIPYENRQNFPEHENNIYIMRLNNDIVCT